MGLDDMRLGSGKWGPDEREGERVVRDERKGRARSWGIEGLECGNLGPDERDGELEVG